MTHGIWLSETQFMPFAETDSLSGQIATRSRSLDWHSLNAVLPNPDPVLRKMGKSIQVYRDLRSDVDVGNGIRRRKAAIKQLKRGLDRNLPDSAMTKSIQAMLADWDWDVLLGEMQNASLNGYQPVEVIWEKVGKYLVPVQLIAKPPEWFAFDAENQLRFLSKESSFQGELLPDRKFIVPRQDPSYINPYGFPDLSMVFWASVFRKGGMKFWVTFAEKFGMPWVVGKSPRGTQRTENQKLLNDLYSMVQDAVAVIPNDSSVEIMQGVSANGEQYERLMRVCSRDINVALLGQNQTTEMDSNRASAVAGHDVTDAIRDGDKSIICGSLSTVIRWIVELNFDTNERPKFDMWEQEAIDVTVAERDVKLTQAGIKFTPAYFQRVYNLQEGDIATVPDQPAAFAEPDDLEEESVPDQDELDAAIDGITQPEQLSAEMRALLAPLFGAIKTGAKPDALLGILADLYPQMDTSGLQERLARALFVAKVWGKLHALD